MNEPVRDVPYVDQPEWLLVGQRAPDGGVILFATRTPLGPLRLHEERFASTGDRCSVTVNMRDYVKAEAPTYVQALASLFEQWGANPFSDPAAINSGDG